MKNGNNVAKAVVGMKIENAEEYCEKHGFSLSHETETCVFNDKRIQYILQSGIVVSASCG
jgi:hypothetical protein